MEELERGIAAAIGWLEREQSRSGFWVGELESNACMEAEWLLALHVLGVDDDPKTPGVVRGILDRQRSDGSWDVYHGADSGDVNTTVECYAALRAVGESLDSPALTTARRWILAHDGMSRLRNFTKYWLALIGEWPWERTPTLPPELILLPTWAPFNIYQFAAWARATMVPLAILSARRTTRPLPPGRRLDELFPEGRDRHDFRLPRRRSWASWEGVFHVLDRILGSYVRSPLKPGREAAIRLCLEWILKHQDADGAWGGIQPPWVYSLLALRQEGYPLDHPAIRAGLGALDAHWSFRRGDSTFFQASESPVWDTALAMHAMLDCDARPEDHSSMGRAAEWLLDHQVVEPGDWRVGAPGIKGGGWAFQRANRHYPDVDDTAVVLTALHRLRKPGAGIARIDAAVETAADWLVGLQCSCGGWAAYDRDNTRSWLTVIPFCDFGELIDPPSADVTAHAIEALAAMGLGEHTAVTRAVAFLRREQEDDGSWFGRWGVNYVYGTGNVLPGLRAAGVDMDESWVRRAAGWLVSRQNTDGGWGESCASYMDDALRGQGPSTASQTAWGLIGLLAFPTHDFDDAIVRGVEFLLGRQTAGTWDEPEYTGTGFPGYGVGGRVNLAKVADELNQTTALQRGFMLNYNLYRHYFPLMALGRARSHLRHRGDVRLRLDASRDEAGARTSTTANHRPMAHGTREVLFS